jgi:hypothetical protein
MLRFLSARPQPASRLRRHAHNLMSLASLTAFAGGFGWLLIAAGLAINHANGTTSNGTTHLLRLFHWLPLAHADYRVLALAWVLGCWATLAPLVALRRLGKSLWTNPALSLATAQRFRALAHALLFNLLGGWAATLLAATQADQYRVGPGIGSWGLLVATLLAYIVAELVREGAAAADENHGFV